jgi:multimeric flavodoxin WrbA
MIVLGIVGSPRKNGRTNALIDAALEGAAANGAEAKKVYLVDYEIVPLFDASGRPAPKAISALCEEAEAIVLGAPVYYGDINGLTKDFCDSVRIRNENGKPALGFAIAGGSGKGLISGVQSLYHWFYHRQMRAIDPTPVSRFNMQEAIGTLRTSGARLVDIAKDKRPFPGARRDDRWADVLAYYASLPYFDRDPVDEFLMLAQQLVDGATGEKAQQARAELAQALVLARDGDRSAAGRHAVKAYELLYYPPKA